MFSFSQKTLLFGVITVSLSGLLFALDYSVQGNLTEKGVTVELPDSKGFIAQNIPDAPIMPPSDDMPEASSPEEVPPMAAPPVAAPSAPMLSPSVPNMMKQNRRASSLSSVNGDFQPGWRPAPPDEFPRNPFSGVAAVETPVAFKQEFDALAKNIIGFVEVGKNSVLIVQNKVVREGDTVKLVKEKEKGVSMSSDQVKEEASTPVAVFAGVDKKKEIAKFMLGDIEVHVPIPSTRQKIANANGSVSKIEGLATATFIGEKGYFVAALDLLPEADPQKKIYVKTQFGSGVISIVKRDAGTNLVLGRVDTLNMIGLYNGITWAKSTENLGKMASNVMAFDIEKTEGVVRPQNFTLNSSNPKWVAGCPVFVDKNIAGVLGKKGGRLTVIGQTEISRVFPEAFVLTTDDKQKVEGIAPSQLKTEEGNFFNPEKVVGLIYTETAD